MQTVQVNENNQQRYLMGYWLRVGANLLDSIILGLLISMVLAVLSVIAGYRLSPIDLPLIAPICLVMVMVYLPGFWSTTGRTAGAWLVSQQLLEVRTAQPPSLARSLLRLLLIPLSILPLGLGFFWICWSARKQAWHDILAGTVVVSDASYVAREEDRIWTLESQPSGDSGKRSAPAAQTSLSTR